MKCHEIEISTTLLDAAVGFTERITDFVKKLSNAHISQQIQL